ncbi:MAG: hypothetical protein J7K54_02295 [Candidatus Aenigmarchaeota archaeon]|nr:hypothetical protein [Candidatus Aenigmarchaeota archaeon]
MTHKLVAVWILGAVFVLSGSLIAGSVDMSLGVSPASYIAAVVLAFVLFLLGGLCWISVASANKGHKWF